MNTKQILTYLHFLVAATIFFVHGVSLASSLLVDLVFPLNWEDLMFMRILSYEDSMK